jgi:hypothetical protein
MPSHICTLCRLRDAMQGRLQSVLLLLFLSFAMARGQALAASPEVKYIGPADLKGRLGDPNLVIIDVSKGWWTYDQKIVGSLVYPEEASSWAPRLPRDKQIVLYCG